MLLSSPSESIFVGGPVGLEEPVVQCLLGGNPFNRTPFNQLGDKAKYRSLVLRGDMIPDNIRPAFALAVLKREFLRFADENVEELALLEYTA